MEITHVIRGEDHLMNTPKHLQLSRPSAARPRNTRHIPLILNPDGSKMSKRDPGAALSYYMENGYVPEAVSNYLCLLGWSPKDDREVLPIEEVQRLFDRDHLNHHNAKFDLEKCRWMNGEYVKLQSDEAFIASCRTWLTGKPLPQTAALDSLPRLIKPKVRTVPEIAEHLTMLCDGSAPVADDARAKIAAQPDAAAKLTALTGHFDALIHWNREHIQDGVDLAAAELKVKPGALLFPLRVAITGQGHGVDLLPLLEILGKAETVARLRARMPLLTA